MKRSFLVLRTLVIIVCVWLFIGWLASRLRTVDAAFRIELPAWVRLPGLLVTVIGTGLVLTCGAMLSTVGVGTQRGSDFYFPTKFVASGPFRYCRNPMSLGGVLLMLGIALCFRSASCLALSGALFLILHLVIVYIEEPGLEKRFGQSHREYRNTVRRWLPRWRA